MIDKMIVNDIITKLEYFNNILLEFDSFLITKKESDKNMKYVTFSCNLRL